MCWDGNNVDIYIIQGANKEYIRGKEGEAKGESRMGLVLGWATSLKNEPFVQH